LQKLQLIDVYSFFSKKNHVTLPVANFFSGALLLTSVEFGKDMYEYTENANQFWTLIKFFPLPL